MRRMKDKRVKPSAQIVVKKGGVNRSPLIVIKQEGVRRNPRLQIAQEQVKPVIAAVPAHVPAVDEMLTRVSLTSGWPCLMQNENRRSLEPTPQMARSGSRKSVRQIPLMTPPRQGTPTPGVPLLPANPR
jgi:hypothetical protein